MLTPTCSYIYSRNCRLFPASIRLGTKKGRKNDCRNIFKDELAPTRSLKP